MKNSKWLLVFGLAVGVYYLVNNTSSVQGSKRDALAKLPEFGYLANQMNDAEIAICYRLLILKEQPVPGSMFRQQVDAIGVKYNIFT